MLARVTSSDVCWVFAGSDLRNDTVVLEQKYSVSFLVFMIWMGPATTMLTFVVERESRNCAVR